jgi:hypothetical protein
MKTILHLRGAELMEQIAKGFCQQLNDQIKKNLNRKQRIQLKTTASLVP